MQAFSCEIYENFKNIFFTEHLQWLLLTVSGFQPVTLLKKRLRQKCFFVNFAKSLRTSFDRMPADDCFLCLSVNFEKFFRTPILWSTSGKLLISCTSCRISTSSYSKKLFHRCFLSIFKRTTPGYVSKMSWRCVSSNSLTWWCILKTSWRCLEDIFPRHLEDVLKSSSRPLAKTSWRCLQDVLKTSSKRLQDILKMSWIRFCKTSWKRLKEVLKTHHQGEYIRLDQEFLKTSWRRLLKTKT